jgi:hypothetical protein
MVLTGYFVLSPVNRACLPPSPSGYRFRRLDTSVGMSGPHDFAVREPVYAKGFAGLDASPPKL